MDQPGRIEQARDGNIVILTIANASRRNALSMAMRAEMLEMMRAIETDRAIRAVVLTGAGGNFCAGAEIGGDMAVANLADGRDRMALSHTLVRALIKGAKPLIAAVEGWCAGAGLSLAACADTVVAGETARFLASFGKVGLIGDFGLLHTLPARVGQGPARQMLLYATPIDAAEALRIGLADTLAPAGGALQAALTRAASLRGVGPLPVALTRHYLSAGIDAALDWEREVQASLFQTADHAEGKAAFLEKRAAAFTGA